MPTSNAPARFTNHVRCALHAFACGTLDHQAHTPPCVARPHAPSHDTPRTRIDEQSLCQAIMPEGICLQATSNHQPVMSRACGNTPGHTPLRVQKWLATASDEWPTRLAHPTCANQEGQRNHHDAHEPSYSLKQRVPAAQAANNHRANHEGGSPSDCLPLWVATPPDNN